ncbi:MAG: hypothetical protein KJZ54_13055 [Phycisphaerales bacterium]|nr:hypothetical protein [Phycisphaerales bacterium]
MFSKGTDVFFTLPEESASRVLHAAKVVDVRGGMFVARFEEPGISVAPGAEVAVFFQGRAGFMQQPARITALLEESDTPSFGFQTTGDAVSCESRECFRVCTVTTGFSATIDGEAECPLTDVSATGFSMISGGNHGYGAVVTVEVEYERTTYSGRARVQSIKPLTPGRTRYGLLCLPSDGPRSLLVGMQRISAAVQRQQLRRRSGTG